MVPCDNNLASSLCVGHAYGCNAKVAGPFGSLACKDIR